MGALSARRVLEWLLGLYFLSHIPITLLFDLQAVLPRELYPDEVRAPGGPGRARAAAWGGPPRAPRRCPAPPRPLSSARDPRGGVSVPSPRPSRRRPGPDLLCSPTPPPSGLSLSVPDSSPGLAGEGGGQTLCSCKKAVIPRVCLKAPWSVCEGSGVDEPGVNHAWDLF